MANRKLTMRDCTFSHRKSKGYKQRPKEAKPNPPPIPELKAHTIEWARQKKKEYEEYGYFLWRNEAC